MSMVRVQSGVAAIATVVLLVGCGGGGSSSGGGGGGGMQPQQMGFIDKALVADTSALQSSTGAATLDANLKNPWGIAFGPGLPVWVANQVTSTTTLYAGNGTVQTAYSGAPAAIAIAHHGPTGVVYNSSISGNSGSFTLPDGAPAQFIYATLSGTIEGWDLATAASTHTAYTAPAGTAYTGLALGQDGSGNYFLYAADFANGKVDMLDHGFSLVTPAGAFATPAGVPSGYVPYGIQNIPAAGGAAQIYVAYALQNAGKTGAMPGAGNGYVAQFDHTGTLVKLLISGGSLNAPWGMALAPSGFGSFGGALLVGNFGDGNINAYNASTGALMGSLNAPSGTPLALSGLWGIAFGNGADSQPTTTLFYAAGANNQADGIYGAISYGSGSSSGGGGGGGY